LELCQTVQTMPHWRLIQTHVSLSTTIRPSSAEFGNEVGVEDGIVSLGTNDDFMMGTPPGAPGAITMDILVLGTITTPTRLPTSQLSLDVRRATSHSHGSRHHRDSDSGPYRDENVLLSLQLLAYLSKYPHVRPAFYNPRATFHPASVNLTARGAGANTGARLTNTTAGPSKGSGKESHGFFRAFGTRGTEKEK
jgi:hypothetical protein